MKQILYAAFACLMLVLTSCGGGKVDMNVIKSMESNNSPVELRANMDSYIKQLEIISDGINKAGSSDKYWEEFEKEYSAEDLKDAQAFVFGMAMIGGLSDMADESELNSDDSPLTPEQAKKIKEIIDRTK